MKLRLNEICPIHRSRFCCGREPGHLSCGDAATITEGCDQESVDVGVSLKTVEHRRNAFVDERNSADLDGYGAVRSLCCEWKICAKACGSDEFAKSRRDSSVMALASIEA